MAKNPHHGKDFDRLAVVNVDTWQILYFKNAAGDWLKVGGECPSDKCGAYCCKNPVRCEYLTDQDLCTIANTKMGQKPVFCFFWPILAATVAEMKDCGLKLAKVPDTEMKDVA